MSNYLDPDLQDGVGLFGFPLPFHPWHLIPRH